MKQVFKEHIVQKNKKGNLISLIIILIVIFGVGFFGGFYFSSFKNTNLKNEPESTIQNYNDEGWNLFDDNKFEESIAEFTKAFKLDPNNAETNLGLGWAYFELGDHENSLKVLNKSLSINQNEESTYTAIGYNYLLLGDYDKAIENFQISLRINPDRESSYRGLGWVYYKLEDFQKSVNYFNRSLNTNTPLNPLNTGGLYHGLGSAYARMGEYEKALGFLEDARKIWDISDVKLSRAINLDVNLDVTIVRTTYHFKGYKVVEKLLDGLIKKYPTECKPYWLKGWIHYMEKDYSNSLQYLPSIPRSKHE